MPDADKNRRRSRVRILVLGSLFVSAAIAWKLGLFQNVPPLSAAERQIVGSWEAEGDGWFKPLNPPLSIQLTLTEDRRFVYHRGVRGGPPSVSRGSWRVTGNTLFLRSHVPFWIYLRECYRQRGLATIPESKLRLEGDPQELVGGAYPLQRVETVR